ncbi:MAG TPA: hypothetical protein VJ973_10620 [Christiangramia sp.]|nr:hypothetical protein [Christiangramia sp.]
MKKLIFCLLILFLNFQFGLAQEDEETEIEIEQEQEENEKHRKHAISLGIGHAHVNSGIKNGDKQWLVLPSWVLDYNFWFKENWAVGLHTDMIIETFEAEHGEGSEGVIERENPIAIVGAVSFKPVHWVALVAGGGVEYEAEESFGLVRLGVEPAWEVTEKWEVFTNLSYDIKFEAYDTWNLALGIARRF